MMWEILSHVWNLSITTETPIKSGTWDPFWKHHEVIIKILRKFCLSDNHDLIMNHDAVFKIRSETCRTEAQFCENLYMIKKESLPNLAGPTQILPVNVRGPALILKTDDAIRSPIYTCHDSSAVVTCVKLWPDLIIIFKVTDTLFS